MKRKLVEFGEKAFDMVIESFDNPIVQGVVGATIGLVLTSVVYNRGVKDACTLISELSEAAEHVESK